MGTELGSPVCADAAQAKMLTAASSIPPRKSLRTCWRTLADQISSADLDGSRLNASRPGATTTSPRL